ncbi:hypothetical protein [Plantactinospora sp. KLBMP9567]|uniref:hypothetical protein n=1 Tax=Plantactinospora sp. KLBMP9567 TaxID=3085900 RepID=UPI002980E8B0|nr:hypothetical protein [Plantactinospora sp. KLBMP9567]MDW5327034.1 hypothetical protein [Plantactinospora sp. KLBMP9567]
MHRLITRKLIGPFGLLPTNHQRQQNLDYEPYAYDTPEDPDAALRSRGELRLARDVSLAPNEKYRDAPNAKYRDAPNAKYRDAPNEKYRDAPNEKYRDDQYRSVLARAWDESVAEIRPPAYVPLQIATCCVLYLPVSASAAPTGW